MLKEDEEIAGSVLSHASNQQAVRHKVSPNDTLESIAAIYNTTPSELARLNRLSLRMVFPGQDLKIPPKFDNQRLAKHVSLNEAKKPSFGSGSVAIGLHKDSFTLNNEDSKSKVIFSADSPKDEERQLLDDSQSQLQAMFLKLNAQYLFCEELALSDQSKQNDLSTDDTALSRSAGISGVLLITPDAVMFDPHADDKAAQHIGGAKCSVLAPLPVIVSVSAYRFLPCKQHNSSNLQKTKSNADAALEKIVEDEAEETHKAVSQQLYTTVPTSLEACHGAKSMSVDEEEDSKFEEPRVRSKSVSANAVHNKPHDLSSPLSNPSTETTESCDNTDIESDMTDHEKFGEERNLPRQVDKNVSDAVQAKRSFFQRASSIATLPMSVASKTASVASKTASFTSKTVKDTASFTSKTITHTSKTITHTAKNATRTASNIFKPVDADDDSVRVAMMSALPKRGETFLEWRVRALRSSRMGKRKKMASESELKQVETFRDEEEHHLTATIKLMHKIDHNIFCKQDLPQIFHAIEQLHRLTVPNLSNNDKENSKQNCDERQNLYIRICLHRHKRHTGRNQQALPGTTIIAGEAFLKTEYWFRCLKKDTYNMSKFFLSWPPYSDESTMKAGGAEHKAANEGFIVYAGEFNKTGSPKRTNDANSIREDSDTDLESGSWVKLEKPLGSNALSSIEDLSNSPNLLREWEVVALDEAMNRAAAIEDNIMVKTSNEELRLGDADEHLSASEIESFLPELCGASEIFPSENEQLDQSGQIKGAALKSLNNALPPRAQGYPWKLVYSSGKHGFSLKTMYRLMQPLCESISQNPVCILILKDSNNNVFGAVLSQPIRMSDHFYGTGESSLFSFYPHFKHYSWSGENSYFIKGNQESLCIGSGGGHFGLWLDGDIYHGRTQRCKTFNNEPLTANGDFVIKTCEAWAVC